MRLHKVYKVKFERTFSYNNIGGMEKFWSSEIKWLTSFEKIRPRMFKIKSSCTDLIKFLNLHVIGEDYHIPYTDYTIKFLEISRIDGYPCFELTSGQDLDKYNLETSMLKNGISSSIGIIHKFQKVCIEPLKVYKKYKIDDGDENKSKFITLEDLEYMVEHMDQDSDLKLLSVTDDKGTEFNYDGNSKDFIKKIRREKRIRNLLNKDI